MQFQEGWTGVRHGDLGCMMLSFLLALLCISVNDPIWRLEWDTSGGEGKGSKQGKRESTAGTDSATLYFSDQFLLNPETTENYTSKFEILDYMKSSK